MTLRLLPLLLCSCTAPGGRDGGGRHPDTGPDTGGDTGQEALASADVVVIGAGPAGLATAIEAAASGARVLVIEQRSFAGGSVPRDGGSMTFSGTPLQEQAGYQDSPELLLSDWQAMTGGDPSDPWMQLFAQRNVSDVYDWLVDMGAGFTLNPELDDGATVPRGHGIDYGISLGELLAAQLPDDTFLFETRATGLVQDAAGGVGGVRVEQDGGQVRGRVSAGAVVVATGGFLRDPELVSWADPSIDLEAACLSAGWTADGNGHDMLGALGASWQNPSAIGIYVHGIEDPREPGEDLVLSPMKEMVWVNREGRRFVDETRTDSFRTGRAMLAQPGQRAWAVFDADTRQVARLYDPLFPEDGPVELPELSELEDAGVLLRADTLDDLATAIGVDASAMKQEIDTFDTAIQDGTDDPWRGEPAGVGQIDTAPFYAIEIVPVLAKAFGGIELDTSGRVLDAGGAPIPGLYAAGELTGMAGGSLVGGYGFNGSLSAVLLSGRVAGMAAAGGGGG